MFVGVAEKKFFFLNFYPSGILIAQLLFPKMVASFIIVWALHVAFFYFKGYKEINVLPKLRWSRNPVLILPFAYWLLHLIGLLYSENLSLGAKDLETKFSFIFLPGLFFFSHVYLNGKLLRMIFIAAIFVSLLLCWIMSLGNFWNEVYAREHNIVLADYPSYNYFFSSYLSHFLHPGYFSMFILVGLLFIVQEIEQTPGYRTKFCLIFLLFLSLISLVFLASKSALIVVGIFMVYFTFFHTTLSFRNKILMVFLSCLLLFFSFSLPWVKNSFTAGYHSIMKDVNNQKEENSSSLRLISWKTALTLWQEQPFIGCGTGDTKDEMIKLYRYNGNLLSAEKKLNAHSQVLQGLATLGIVGVLLTLLLLLLPIFYRGFMSKLLGIILIVFGFTESIFETQAGVIFYCLMIPWLLSSKKVPGNVGLQN